MSEYHTNRNVEMYMSINVKNTEQNSFNLASVQAKIFQLRENSIYRYFILDFGVIFFTHCIHT